MRVVFRADANKNVGMGHIMRCLSIADAFSAVGCCVEFLNADDTVSDLIRSRGYSVIVLNSDYQKMEEELECWPQNINADFVVVDSYYATAEYLRLLRSKTKDTVTKLVYIDDICAFAYPVDILIDYNAFATEDIYNKLYASTDVKQPQLILGPTYAPLRRMFCGIDRKMQNEIVKNVLISTGGSDELHLALAMVRRIIDLSVKTDCIYHVLLGAMNADKKKIRELTSKETNIILHEDISDMKSLISSCDLAISAAGSTLYEISACGVPLITYSLADNQLPGAKAFEHLGLAVNVGDIRDPKTINASNIISGALDDSAVDRILSAVEELGDNYRRREIMGKKMQEMIDGLGAERMVEKMLDLV